MSTPLVVVHRDATVLAQAVAARIIAAISDAQASNGTASIVLTGGGIGGATLRALAESAARPAIDWGKLSIWWGDERFLPVGHPDRNETQACEALLDYVEVDPALVHPMPASDGPLGDDLDAAAAHYAEELAAAADAGAPSPIFDVLLLGLGPDGHIASLFPEAAGLRDDRAVVPVRGAPKPPPTRISLSYGVINVAREIWVIAAGEEKAGAVQLSLTVADPVRTPAAGAHGTVATKWLLDRAAASQL